MNSPWFYSVVPPKFPTLKGNKKTDVLIVGGGIAGILTAYFLKEKGIDYILVEKDKICQKTTGHTTAKITSQHALLFQKLLKSYGKENTQLFYKANENAVAMYRKMSQSIDCDFETKSNFVYSLDNIKALEKELDAANSIGIPMNFQQNLPLPFKTKGAVYLENQGQFHPLKFLYAISKDLNIYENTFVSEVRGNTAVTPYGNITAEKILIATHFPFIDSHGSYFMKMYQSRSYVIAIEKAENIDGMFIDENSKGLSFRNYGDLLFVGGSAHRTGKKSEKYTSLRSFAKKHYPTANEKYRWAAQDPITLDGAPYIGHYSRRTHELYVATGFNKWGMSGAMVSAMILSDMLSGKENKFAKAFSPHRSMIKPQLFLNAGETVINLLKPTRKRCTHLGCALKYNPQEHSRDCPCHGSRFHEDGRVLDTPANKNLN